MSSTRCLVKRSISQAVSQQNGQKEHIAMAGQSFVQEFVSSEDCLCCYLVVVDRVNTVCFVDMNKP